MQRIARRPTARCIYLVKALVSTGCNRLLASTIMHVACGSGSVCMLQPVAQAPPPAMAHDGVREWGFAAIRWLAGLPDLFNHNTANERVSDLLLDCSVHRRRQQHHVKCTHAPPELVAGTGTGACALVRRHLCGRHLFNQPPSYPTWPAANDGRVLGSFGESMRAMQAQASVGSVSTRRKTQITHL